MKNKFEDILLLTFTLLFSPYVFSHSRFGEDSSISIVHFISNSYHAIPIILGLVSLAILSFCLWIYYKENSTRKS